MTEGPGQAITVDVNRAIRWLLVIVALLVAANALVHVAAGDLDTGVQRTLQRLFALNAEGTLPAFFSSVLLLLASAALWVVMQVERRSKGGAVWPWRVLTIGFLYLAIDENVALHERWGAVAGWLGVERTGYFYWNWVVPAGAVVLALGLLLARFWWTLPSPTRRGFAAAGCVYLAGALGFEVLSAPVAEAEGLHSGRYLLLTSVEETLEMLGVVTFLSVLGRHIEGRAMVGVLPLAAAGPVGLSETVRDDAAAPATAGRADTVMALLSRSMSRRS